MFSLVLNGCSIIQFAISFISVNQLIFFSSVDFVQDTAVLEFADTPEQGGPPDFLLKPLIEGDDVVYGEPGDVAEILLPFIDM